MDLFRTWTGRRAAASCFVISAATQRIAGLQAQLRAEHLNTHLAQTALLSPAQALRYSELRGYATATPSVNPAQHRGQTHRH